MSRKTKWITKQTIAILLAAAMILLPAAEAFAESDAGLQEAEVYEEVSAEEASEAAVPAAEEPVPGEAPEALEEENKEPEDAEESIESPEAVSGETGGTAEEPNAKESAPESEQPSEKNDPSDAVPAGDPDENNSEKAAQAEKTVETAASEPAAAKVQAADAVKEEAASPAVPEAAAEPEGTAGYEESKPGLIRQITTLVMEKLVLRAAAGKTFDNSTNMATGEYTADDWNSFTWGGGTGKAKLTLTKIIVKDGKAEGVFTASSANMSHVYYGGHTGVEDDDPEFYDPATDTCGELVLPIQNQTVTFPIRLNETIEVACRTTAMTVPHWIQYSYTIDIDIIEEEDQVTDLAVTNDFSGLKISSAKLTVNSVSTMLDITAGSKTFTKLYFGTAAQAEKDDSKAIAIDNADTFSADASALTGKTSDISFYFSEDRIWHEGTINVDANAATLTLKEGDKADYSGVEAAKAKVPKDLSVYKASRVKTLQDALDAVKEGYYASQQSVVDGFAEAIEKAIAALEKEKLTITLKAVDEETGKAVSGAKYTVTDKDGKTVTAESAGVYALVDGKYTIKATASGYEDETLKDYSVKVEETVTVKMTKEEVIPEGTTVFRENEKDPSKTNLFNNTPMFKVVRGELVTKNGKSTLTVTLNGSGYHYFYKGTFEEAMANGFKKENWIAGKQNSEGKWTFTIPLEKSETFIPIVSISQTHLEKAESGEEKLEQALFPRQLELDLKKSTLTAGDYDATVDITVISKAAELEAESKGTMGVVGGPTSNNYACKPVITMKNSRFTKAFIGTAEGAAKDGAKIISPVKNAFTFEFVNSFGANGRVIMFTDKEPVAIALYDSEKGAWVDYKLTIDKAASTVTLEGLAEGETPVEPVQPDNSSDSEGEGSSDGSWTAPTDSSTTLADGVYTPDSFRYSGGTGKIVITCTKLEIKNGQAYATLHFGKPGGGEASVDRLRAGGSEYPGFNTFTIPVQLNANQAIVARTVAMSAPHWIDYSIFIALAIAGTPDADENAKEFSENTSTLDETAPKIPGLTAEGEIEVEYSDLIKIFTYKDGYYLIEVNTYSDTFRDTVEYRTEEEKAKKEDAGKKEDKDKQETVEEDEGTAAESISELIAELYRSEIVKYLVIPGDKEVPAGLDKEIIIIHQPADRSYVSSADALEALDKLGVLENVTTVGIPEEEIKIEAVLAGLEKKEGEKGRVVFAGEYGDWDLKTMILQKTNFALSSSEILPNDKKTAEKDMDNYIRLAERAAQMDMALFVDRSSDETNELAKAEWYKIYGVIYGENDKAEKLYKEVVDAASDKEKEEALKEKEERSKTSEKNRKAAEEAAEKS